MHWFLVGLLVVYALFDIYYHWFMKIKCKDYIYLGATLALGIATLIMTFFIDGSAFDVVMVILNSVTAFLKLVLSLVHMLVEYRSNQGGKENA